MIRTVKFVGSLGVGIEENYPLYVFQQGEDVEFLNLKKNQQYDLTEEQFKAIPKSAFDKGVFMVTMEDVAVVVKAAGEANFVVDSDNLSPTYGTAPNVIINHNIGNALYEVAIMDNVNFSVVNTDVNSIEIARLTSDPEGPSSVGYAITSAE